MPLHQLQAGGLTGGGTHQVLLADQAAHKEAEQGPVAEAGHQAGIPQQVVDLAGVAADLLKLGREVHRR